MEGRMARGRGSGGWRRGGRGSHDSDSHGGEHRGRGRGGHRGRGKRDHHRGRGRGGGGFPLQDQDEGEKSEEEDHGMMFSRRKLESNWDRYQESEQPEKEDDIPAQRGADYHVLLESAGNWFTHFRFSDEKDWDVDLFAAGQMFPVPLDLQEIGQRLQQLPAHLRLDLEPELVQDLAAVDPPAVDFTPKAQAAQTVFAPPSAAFRGLSLKQRAPPAAAGGLQGSSTAAEDEVDEELDQLLGLQEPAESGAQEEPAPEEVKEVASAAGEEESEAPGDDGVAPQTPPPGKEQMTEEDLEDWLDSMIS